MSMVEGMPEKRPHGIVAVKWRAWAFVIVTVVVLAVWMRYENTGSYPYRNFVGSTWYGPWLLMLIPISLAWLSLAAKTKFQRVLGLGCADFLFLTALFFIMIHKTSTLPGCF